MAFPPPQSRTQNNMSMPFKPKPLYGEHQNGPKLMTNNSSFPNLQAPIIPHNSSSPSLLLTPLRQPSPNIQNVQSGFPGQISTTNRFQSGTNTNYMLPVSGISNMQISSKPPSQSPLINGSPLMENVNKGPPQSNFQQLTGFPTTSSTVKTSQNTFSSATLPPPNINSANNFSNSNNFLSSPLVSMAVQNTLPPPPPQLMNQPISSGFTPPSSASQLIPTGFPPPPAKTNRQPTSIGNQQQDNQFNYNNFNTNGNSQMSGHAHMWNLMQDRRLIPHGGIETPKPNLPHNWKNVNCSPEIFRCTLNSIPSTSNLLQKSRLPLGVLIHPFKDLSQLPVIQSSSIVRCKSCRTYINPFVNFVDNRRWKCNLCFRLNEVPEEFCYDPVSKTYGDPQRRPEIQSATVEFIAPSEYMVRPPQAACYVFVLDVSFNAVHTGYLSTFCSTLNECLDSLPGDKRMQIAFITFDRTVQFYSLDNRNEPHMMVVSDIDDIFLPTAENLMVNMHENNNKAVVQELLSRLPDMFGDNRETTSALGAALQAAKMLVSSTGGRITVVQTVLPSIGPGALKCREDPNDRASKDVKNLGPATDFYKSFSLTCSESQIAVDLFVLASQYVDLATLSGMAKFSGGCMHYYQSPNIKNNAQEMERFEDDFRRYLVRKIGFEAVMRLRCTKGLTIHTFHGNFFVRSTDLLSLPNINPDAGYGMQLSIEEPLTDMQTVSFQVALLYTSSKGERRIRVHTLCLPVANSIQDIFVNADQEAIIGLLAKMAVEKSLTSLSDARDAMMNSVIDMLNSYMSSVTGSKASGALMCPHSLRLVPLFVLALLKFTAFRAGVSTKLDERYAAMELCKTEPLQLFMLHIYPRLYPVHNLDDKNAISKNDDEVVPQPPIYHLSAAYLERNGAYILDCGSKIYMWVGSSASVEFLNDVFGKSSFKEIPDGLTALPELSNNTSELLRNFVDNIVNCRSMGVTFTLIKDDGSGRMIFAQHLIEDRTEGSTSYYEFLQYIQKEIK